MSKKSKTRSASLSSAHRKRYLARKLEYELQSEYARHLLGTRLFESSKAKGLLLISSFVLTDGWISYNKRKKLMELGFSNINCELVNAFRDLVFLTLDEVPSSTRLNSKQKCTRYVAPWHQDMIMQIKSSCFDNGIKTARRLAEIRDRQLLKECMRIGFSCDGFVSFYVACEKYGFTTKYHSRIRPNLSLGCKPIVLRKGWKEVCEHLGFKIKTEKDRIKICSWNGLKKFYSLGGFLPKTFIGGDSKFFKGKDKNTVVKRLLYLKERKEINNKSDLKETSFLRNKIIAGVD